MMHIKRLETFQHAQLEVLVLGQVLEEGVMQTNKTERPGVNRNQGLVVGHVIRRKATKAHCMDSYPVEKHGLYSACKGCQDFLM